MTHSTTRQIVPVLAALVLFALSACGGEDAARTDFPEIKNPPTVTPGQKVNVVATTTQIADFVRVVGGDRVAVTELVKAGVDPHEYEPSPQDAQRIAAANLIAVNGLGLDGYIAKLLQQAGGSKPVALLSRGVKTRTEGKGKEAETDPHIWFSPLNAKQMVDNLATALGQVDPSGNEAYKTNAVRYKGELDALDTRIQAQITTIPMERRKVVTNHDGLGYYIQRYGLTFVGAVIPSLETNAAPSAQQIAEIVRKIRQEKVPAIFTESSLNPKLEEQIAAEAGVKVVASLFVDSLGPAGSPAATYLQMMEYNTKAIVDGLK